MAETAWRGYKERFLRYGRRRQLRKRDFMEGYRLGIRDERNRTREHVVPANLALYDLTRSLEENPELLPLLREQFPAMLEQLAQFLRTGKAPRR